MRRLIPASIVLLCLCACGDNETSSTTNTNTKDDVTYVPSDVPETPDAGSISDGDDTQTTDAGSATDTTALEDGSSPVDTTVESDATEPNDTQSPTDTTVADSPDVEMPDTDEQTDADWISDTGSTTDLGGWTDADEWGDVDWSSDTDEPTDFGSWTDADEWGDVDWGSDTDDETDFGSWTDADEWGDVDWSSDTDDETDFGSWSDADEWGDVDWSSDTDDETDFGSWTDIDNSSDINWGSDADNTTDGGGWSDVNDSNDVDWSSDTDEQTDFGPVSDTDDSSDLVDWTDADDNSDTGSLSDIDDDTSGSTDDTNDAGIDVGNGDSDAGNANNLPAVPGLIFQTGFENNTQQVTSENTTAPCTDDLLGLDLSVPEKGHWEKDLEGSAFGKGHFCFGGGTPEQRGIELVPDPLDPSNQVLRTWIAEPNENVSDNDDIVCNEPEGSGMRKARVQHVLKENPNLQRFDYRVRMRLGKGFKAIVKGEDKVTWMTIGEFWNNNPSEDGSFRITLNMVKHEAVAGAKMHFGLKADKQNNGSKKWIPVWPKEYVSELAVPIGKWFTLEVTIIEGDDKTGRAIAHITLPKGKKHLIGDVTGWTYSPDGKPDGFKEINTMKLYTSGDIMCKLKEMGHVLEVWWDDYAIGAQ